MATLKLVYPRIGYRPPPRPGEKRMAPTKVRLIGESGISVTLPLGPRLEASDIAARFATFDRVGRQPILAVVGRSLRKYSTTLLISGRDRFGNLDYTVSIENELHLLRSIGRSGERVQWGGFGPSEIGWYRITQMSVRDVQRQQGTNHLTVAEITLEMTQASDAILNVGPLTGGAASSGTGGTTIARTPESGGLIPAKSGPAATTPAVRTHTVGAGQTLYNIALMFYGNGNLYPRIADANGLVNPNLIHPGQVLRIP